MSGVELRLARIDALAVDPDPRWLAPGEQARLAGLGESASVSRRRSYLAGRWLLRLALAERVGGEPAAQTVDIDEAGRTRCAPGLFANLSHSGNWVACALADAPVGIDIERADRPRGDLAALAAVVHGPAQCAELAALDETARLRRFYQLWTLKEAALKRDGDGLDLARMRALSFAPDPHGEAFSLELPQAGLVAALVCADAPRLAMPDGACVVARLRVT